MIYLVYSSLSNKHPVMDKSPVGKLIKSNNFMLALLLSGICEIAALNFNECKRTSRTWIVAINHCITTKYTENLYSPATIAILFKWAKVFARCSKAPLWVTSTQNSWEVPKTGLALRKKIKSCSAWPPRPFCLAIFGQNFSSLGQS